jgi:broad specificity phosphatase PhoE
VRLGIVLAALMLLVAPAARAQQAIFVVRHAERADDSDDTELSSAGKARAQRLAEVLRDAGVTAAFSTAFKRTLGTARPLSEARKLSLQPYKDAAGLVASLRTAHAKDVVLVVAHSNTLPEILQRLGATEKITIGHDDYDNLFVLVPKPTGPPLLMRLHY